MSDIFALINPNPPEPPEIKELYCSHLPRPDRVLYRYEIRVENFTDSGIHVSVYRLLFPVIGETYASWVYDEYGQRRHVLKGNGKRRAHDTEENALFSLRKRTRWRQSHAHWALTQAHEAIEVYNRLFGGDKPIEKVGLL